MKMDESGPEQFLANTIAEAQDADFVQGSDLRPFADQLIAIARQLREGEFIASDAPAALTPNKERPRTSAPAPIPANRDHYAAMARKAYAIRRRRGGIFGNADLFGEPAWDILLDLYVAFVEQKPVSVSSACIGSAAPPTTGLRWLGVLAEEDLIVREPDPDDQRRVLVRLTERGVEAMDSYFANAASR